MTTKDKDAALERYRRLMDEIVLRSGKSLTALAHAADLRHTTLTRPYNGKNRNPPKRETIHKVLVANGISASDLQMLELGDRALYAGERGDKPPPTTHPLEARMDPAEVLIVEALAKRSPERIWALAEAAIRRQAEITPNPLTAG